MHTSFNCASCLKDYTYPGNFAPCLCKVLLLCSRQQLLAAGYSEYNGISHTIVMEAEINSAFKIASQQGLGDQAIDICRKKNKLGKGTFLHISEEANILLPLPPPFSYLHTNGQTDRPKTNSLFWLILNVNNSTRRL